MTKDPVCGMDVNEITAPAKTTYAGRTYYFCSTDCLKEFKADPEQYLAQAARMKA